jgi:predicted ArsR family transcriptional regulator
MLGAVAAASGVDPEECAEVGRAQGRTAGRSRRSDAGCVAALVHELAELGFDPATGEDDDGTTTVVFTHCPYRELAEAFPDLVCHLHRGLVEGFVDAQGGATVEEFGTLADREPCQVVLAAG